MDLAGLDACAQREQLEALSAAEASTPYDLVGGPLVRGRLVRLAADRHVLVLGVHHSMCDDGSALQILRDLANLYGARTGRERPTSLPPGHEVRGLGLVARGIEGRRGRAGGRRVLAGPLPRRGSGDRPPSRPPPTRVKTYVSAREDRALEETLVKELKRAAGKERTSLFTFLLSGFAALLHRLTRQDDLVVGILAGGQSAGVPEGLVGHSINTLPIRVQPRPDGSARELVRQVGATLLDAYEHQPFPFPRLLEQLGLDRDESRLPLVSVAFNFEQGFSASSLDLPGLEAALLSFAPRFDPYDLFVNAVESDGRVALECRYNLDLFDGATVARWLECYEAVLRGMASRPADAVVRIPLLPAADRASLRAWNGEQLPYPGDRTVAELIGEQAARTPRTPWPSSSRGRSSPSASWTAGRTASPTA